MPDSVHWAAPPAVLKALTIALVESATYSVEPPGSSAMPYGRKPLATVLPPTLTTCELPKSATYTLPLASAVTPYAWLGDDNVVNVPTVRLAKAASVTLSNATRLATTAASREKGFLI